MIKKFLRFRKHKSTAQITTTPRLLFVRFHFAILQDYRMLNIQEKIMFRFSKKKQAREKKKILFYTLENHLLPHKLHPPPVISRKDEKCFWRCAKEKKSRVLFLMAL
jgi:hypothetical protein